MKPDRYLILIGFFAGLFLYFGALSKAEAKTINVPSQYKTIQSAVDSASEGDIVLVEAGRYKENVVLKDGVILRGSGADTTTIDGGGKGNVVVGAKGSVIEGFTITNSGKTGMAGNSMDVGIFASSAPMTIANCRITGNNGGIRVYYSPSNILNNVISDNKYFGVFNFYSDSIVKNNIIYNNGSEGIKNSYSQSKIINNTVYRNAMGIYSEVSKVVIKNNIIAENLDKGIMWAEFPDAQEGVEPILSNNIVWKNKKDYHNLSAGKGDISKDPPFTDADKGDFHLKGNSDIGAFGGSMAQSEIPLPPDVRSYADLKILKANEPDAMSQTTWAGGNTSGAGNFNSYCIPCHGPEGKGDGVLASSLTVKPRNLTNAELLSLRTDDFLFKVIKEGGPSVGFSENMPSWGGQLNDEEIKNVIAYIRSDICKCSYKGKK